MSVPILSFVGRSNSGKTTLIERVIPMLVRAGYKVATVKHAGHGFDLDTEGKDSWRHKQAGASSACPSGWWQASHLQEQPGYVRRRVGPYERRGCA